jgi:hypothetical protein
MKLIVGCAGPSAGSGGDEPVLKSSVSTSGRDGGQMKIGGSLDRRVEDCLEEGFDRSKTLGFDRYMCFFSHGVSFRLSADRRLEVS